MMKKEENREIEQENLGDTTITIPFNPSDIKMDTQTVNLGSVVEMLKFGEINMKPDFQRSADLWNEKQKSRLIESILLGIPLPSFYFNEDSYGNWEVIDGLQRLCSLKDYIIDKKLKLRDLEFLGKKYNGTVYSELSREDQRRINGHKVTLNVINKGTPKKVKYVIFKRVNTAGLQLTPQEMRHALNQGVPADFIAELATLKEFKKATDSKISTKRMEDRDFTNRFVAFYLAGSSEKLKKIYEGELDGFLNSALETLEKISETELNKVREDFIASMCIAYQIFGNDAFRKRYSNEDTRNPISKAVFDSVSVNLAWIGSEKRAKLIKLRNVFKKGLIELFNNSKFDSAISTGTGQKGNVQTRFEEVEKLIKRVIEND